MSNPEVKLPQRYTLTNGTAYIYQHGGNTGSRRTTIEFCIKRTEADLTLNGGHVPDVPVYYDIQEKLFCLNGYNETHGLDFAYREKSNKPRYDKKKHSPVNKQLLLFISHLYNKIQGNEFEGTRNENHLSNSGNHFKMPSGIFDVLTWLLGDLNEPIDHRERKFNQARSTKTSSTSKLSKTDINTKIMNHFIQKHANRTWLRSDKTHNFYWDIIKDNLFTKYDSKFNEILKTNFILEKEHPQNFLFFKNHYTTSASGRALAVYELLNSAEELEKKIILHTIMNHEQDTTLQKKLASEFEMSAEQLRQVIDQDIHKNHNILKADFIAAKQVIIHALYKSDELTSVGQTKLQDKFPSLIEKISNCCLYSTIPKDVFQRYLNNLNANIINKLNYNLGDSTKIQLFSHQLFQTKSYKNRYTIQAYGFDIKGNFQKYLNEQNRFDIIKKLFGQAKNPTNNQLKISAEQKMFLYGVLHSSKDKQWNTQVIEKFNMSKSNLIRCLKYDLMKNHHVSLHDLNATKQVVLDVIDNEFMIEHHGKNRTEIQPASAIINNSMKRKRESYNSDLEQIKRFFTFR